MTALTATAVPARSGSGSATSRDGPSPTRSRSVRRCRLRRIQPADPLYWRRSLGGERWERRCPSLEQSAERRGALDDGAALAYMAAFSARRLGDLERIAGCWRCRLRRSPLSSAFPTSYSRLELRLAR